MNQTLDNVKAIVEQAATERSQARQERLSKLERLAEAARPLLDAFADLEGQYLRVSVLQRLWPRDFETRRDTVGALLVGYVADQGLTYGLSIRVPGGCMRFAPEIQPNGELVFLTSQDIGDSRPTTREFINRDDWLNFFLRTLADVIEFLE